ncbi:MAG: acetyl-CoA carboxylase biotin carboxylase subunit [Oceanococcus sp.]
MSIDTSHWPFDTVLIANRGEIAVRILRSIHTAGLKGVLVYHAADQNSPAVALADQAIEIHGDTPVSAYLDGEQIIRVAKESGAGAIHPGYGFLSENAAFAQAVADAGLIFVGPTPQQIELMGDKVRARNFVEKAGFPVAPSAIEDDDPDSFLERAAEVAFPVLIKPSAGGGGKGMRVVRDPKDLAQEIEIARREGQRYFGDGRLYVERYIENPRHIEVQILGDAQGNVVHLFERECSVQRRFQKIIEESPSPALNEETRQNICEAAAGIARAAGYQNAGTVEFIYGEGGEFYFLETNTRLQVEHPVTEEITGIDLALQQLRIAAGDALPFQQTDITRRGHAIEFRIYAEDAGAGFTPTTGPVLNWQVPQGEGIRMDSGIREGQAVTAAFDPMLAKLIVYGDDREQACQRADAALRDLVLLGCKTNTSFLRRVLNHPAFVSGDVHTGFLDANPELAADPELDSKTLKKLLASAAMQIRPMRDVADATPAMHAAMGSWRN